jgi:hypothetical protein
MNQSRNQAILGLSLSAVVLLAVLFVLNAFPRARASVSLASSDYAAASSQVSSSKDVVWIVDVPTQRLIVYRYDRGRKRIERFKGRELGKDLRRD